jgi:hypothetical protein
MATGRKTTKATQKTSPTTAAPLQAKGSRPAEKPSSDVIARRAYEIWLASGQPHGQHEAHWLAAERELGGAAAR